MVSLNDLKNALLTVTDNVGHYEAFEKTDQYIVWAEDGQSDAVWASGKMQAQAITGTIDYFTSLENDPNFNKIQDALNHAGLSFRLESIQHESVTKKIHYEWVWEFWLA